MILILLDSCLHTPMYFCLSNLPLVDFCYPSTVTPKVMARLLWKTRSSTMRVLPRCSLLQSFLLCKMTSWPQWLMTPIQQCTNPPLHHHLDNRCVCFSGHNYYICSFMNASFDVGGMFYFLSVSVPSDPSLFLCYSCSHDSLLL